MLERIALQQTRLRTPGLGLDGKGVALGAKGVVLLPSIDRLVAWLSVYTREHSLEDLMPSLELHLVRSKLGTRELTLSFAAESSDRMDRIAETARLVGGFSFTGTSRHFVQYRDAAAPFGYDATQLLTDNAGIALYHDKFTQVYDTEKSLDLRALLLRLMPHVDPSTEDDTGPRYLVAEQGLGPALIHYLVRSQVEGEVCIAEWPPESAFDEGPVRRTIVRVPDLPKRMYPLFRATPGITPFLPAGPGVAVELGYRHPVALRACPVFDRGGLVLVRGGGKEPWAIDRLPQMGDLRAFARVELRGTDSADSSHAISTGQPEAVNVPLRIVPSSAPWRNVTASRIDVAQIELLRRMAYALPHQTIARTEVAVTPRGVFLRSSAGIEAIPLGTFFVEVHPGLYVPAGYDFVPAVAPEVLFRALGSPSGKAVFIDSGAHAMAVEAASFRPLETLLLERSAIEPVDTEVLPDLLADDAPIELKISGLGAFPMSRAEPLPDEPTG